MNGTDVKYKGGDVGDDEEAIAKVVYNLRAVVVVVVHWIGLDCIGDEWEGGASERVGAGGVGKPRASGREKKKDQGQGRGG